MGDKITVINELKRKVEQFIKDRNWEQYHSPKNLSMSIAIEAAELMERFQWLEGVNSYNISKKEKQAIEEEVADIAIYLLDFCNILGIDLSSSIAAKLKRNGKKYPIGLVKGKAHKYTHYESKNK